MMLLLSCLAASASLTYFSSSFPLSGFSSSLWHSLTLPFSCGAGPCNGVGVHSFLLWLHTSRMRRSRVWSTQDSCHINTAVRDTPHISTSVRTLCCHGEQRQLLTKEQNAAPSPQLHRLVEQDAPAARNTSDALLERHHQKDGDRCYSILPPLKRLKSHIRGAKSQLSGLAQTRITM